MPRVMNKIRSFHIMTSATFWFVIAEIASAADQTPKALPLLTDYHFVVILAIVILMVILFYLLFRWWQKVEQSSYFGMLFRDTIEFNETSRLRAPIDAAWKRGKYWNEILRGETERGERWVEGHPRRSRMTISKLAKELHYEYDLINIQQETMEIPEPEIGMVSGGVNRIPGSGNPRPGSGDGFRSMYDPWGLRVPPKI